MTSLTYLLAGLIINTQVSDKIHITPPSPPLRLREGEGGVIESKCYHPYELFTNSMHSSDEEN
jgi:hypothetical protein